MRKLTALILVLALLMSFAIIFSPAKAENRTIVVPDDYPTISSAIANATDGDTVQVRSGVFQETQLNVSKKISLEGENAQSTQINLDSPSHEEVVDVIFHAIWHDPAMTVNSDNFKLSGFTITSTGGSISITGNRTKITNNIITSDLAIRGSQLDISQNTFTSQMKQNGITVAGNCNKISSNNIIGAFYIGGQNNIVSFNNVIGDLSISTTNSFVHDNNINTDINGRFSISGNNNVVCKNVANHLAYGITVSGSNNKVFLNQITHCTIGIWPSSGNSIYANYIANNAWGVYPWDNILNPTGNDSTFYHNNIENNKYGQVTTIFHANMADYFDNGKEGNYWSDYNGEDANGDGVGDTPYIIDDNRSDRYPLMSPFNLSSIADTIPDWAAAPTVQIISPQAKTYQADVALNFTVNKQTSTLTYSLDGDNNVTVTENTTLTNLPSGLHTITVYAKDVFDNVGVSETISFTMAEPFSTTLIAVTSVTVLLVACSVAILLIRKKRQKS